MRYEKVLFLDADTVILSNIDHLFELKAPAATFSSPWAQPWGANGSGMTNPYLSIQHGERIGPHILANGLNGSYRPRSGFSFSHRYDHPDRRKTRGGGSYYDPPRWRPPYSGIPRSYGFRFNPGSQEDGKPFPHMYSERLSGSRSFANLRPEQSSQQEATPGVYSTPYRKHGSFTLIGTCVLLSPSLRDWKDFQKMLSLTPVSPSLPATATRTPTPFGFSECHSGFDEQALAYFYQNIAVSRNEKIGTWTMIHQQYNAIPWHPNWLQGKQPYLFHYFHTKPWEMKRGAFLDLETFWELVFNLLEETRAHRKHLHSLLEEAFPLDQLYIASHYDSSSHQMILRGCGWCEHLHEAKWTSHQTFDPSSGVLACPLLISKRERSTQRPLTTMILKRSMMTTPLPPVSVPEIPIPPRQGCVVSGLPPPPPPPIQAQQACQSPPPMTSTPTSFCAQPPADLHAPSSTPGWIGQKQSMPRYFESVDVAEGEEGEEGDEPDGDEEEKAWTAGLRPQRHQVGWKMPWQPSVAGFAAEGRPYDPAWFSYFSRSDVSLDADADADVDVDAPTRTKINDPSVAQLVPQNWPDSGSCRRGE